MAESTVTAMLLIFGWLDVQFSKNWVCFIVSPRLIFITTIILKRSKNTHGLTVVAHSYDLEGKMFLYFFYSSKQTFFLTLDFMNTIILLLEAEGSIDISTDFYEIDVARGRKWKTSVHCYFTFRHIYEGNLWLLY